MAIDDLLLPAAVHLTGPHAVDVLAPVIAATGSELLSCRTGEMQYRPGSDLVVGYRCEVRTGDTVRTERLFAGTTVAGPPAGTLPVIAESPAGTELVVGVWRWPFDPMLPSLAELAAPRRASALLASIVGDVAGLEIVAFRPTERAVIRVSGSVRTAYVKVVPRASTEPLVRRHMTLAGSGVPAARVLAAGDGWMAMEALAGTTLRDRLKSHDAVLLDPARMIELLDRLSTVAFEGVPPVRSRVVDAMHHGAMLAAVLPSCRELVSSVLDRVTGSAASSSAVATVHGDLHEAQLVVDDTSVIGVLDVDDVGPGDPLDDPATLVAHLRARALASDDERIAAYADLVVDVAARRHDRAALEQRAAAVSVGLATGPFRLQQQRWEVATERLLRSVLTRLDGGSGG